MKIYENRVIMETFHLCERGEGAISSLLLYNGPRVEYFSMSSVFVLREHIIARLHMPSLFCRSVHLLVGF